MVVQEGKDLSDILDFRTHFNIEINYCTAIRPNENLFFFQFDFC